MRYGAIALAVAFFALPCQAQQSAQDVDVIRSAITAVRSDILPSGDFTVQPSFWNEDEASDRAVSVLQEVGASVGSNGFARLDEAVSCDGLPNTCRMANGGTSALAVSEPTVEDGTATVEVHMRYRSGSERQPIVGRTVKVRLERAVEGWTVGEMETVRVT